MLVENTNKNAHLSFTKCHKSKHLQSYDRNTISKNSEKQRKFEHKIDFPKKLQICRLSCRLSCIYMTIMFSPMANFYQPCNTVKGRKISSSDTSL